MTHSEALAHQAATNASRRAFQTAELLRCLACAQYYASGWADRPDPGALQQVRDNLDAARVALGEMGRTLALGDRRRA